MGTSPVMTTDEALALKKRNSRALSALTGTTETGMTER